MKTPQFGRTLSSWLARHAVVFAVLAVLAMLVGLGTDRLVGGRVAEIAGRVQFLTVVIYVYVVITIYLFKPYGVRVTSLLESLPLGVLRIAIFAAITGLAAWSVIMAAISIHVYAR